MRRRPTRHGRRPATIPRKASPVNLAQLLVAIRHPPPGLMLLVGWAACCLLARDWTNGTRAFLLLTAAVFVGAYVLRGRKRRLRQLEEEGLPRQPEWLMVWRYLVEWRRRARLRTRWPKACTALGLVGQNVFKAPVPLYGLPSTVAGDLVGDARPGVVLADVDKLQAAAPKLAGLLRGGLSEVIVTPTTPGDCRVEFSYGDPFRKVLPLSKMQRPLGDHHMAYGIRWNGAPAELDYLQSVMIGGLTRRGKSVVGKAFVASLMMQGVPVALYVADLKGGQELPEFEQVGRLGDSSVEVAAYARDVKAVENMLDRMNKRAIRRAEIMRDTGIKQWTPTPEEPLLVAWVDETVPLRGKLRTDTPIGEIAFMGAARAATLWLNTQLGEKTITGEVRDLVPQAVCFATKTWQQTDMVLGDGAHQAGALCHRLGDKRGVGYSGSNDDHLFHKFRAYNVTPAEARDLARGVLPRALTTPQGGKRLPAERRHILYRCYDDSPEWSARFGDRPVYIGRTSGESSERRFAQHEKLDWKWCPLHRRMENFWRVHGTRTTEVDLPTLDALKREERHAIETELPVFNHVHNGGGHFGRRMRARFTRPAVGKPQGKPPRPARPAVYDQTDALDGVWSE